MQNKPSDSDVHIIECVDQKQLRGNVAHSQQRILVQTEREGIFSRFALNDFDNDVEERSAKHDHRVLDGELDFKGQCTHRLNYSHQEEWVSTTR